MLKLTPDTLIREAEKSYIINGHVRSLHFCHVTYIKMQNPKNHTVHMDDKKALKQLLDCVNRLTEIVK